MNKVSSSMRPVAVKVMPAAMLALCLLPVLSFARDAVVFVAGHPDDFAGCSGTAFLLAERYDVHLVDYTHGEWGLGEKGALDGSTGRMRTKEEENVCAYIGAKLHWMDEVDSMATAPRETVERLAALFRDIRPKAVILHWPIDIHCDHAMSSVAAWRAILLAGIRNTCEVYYQEQTSQSRTFRPSVFVDITRVKEKKDRLISMYKCQWPEAMIANKHADAVFWGKRIGVGYAEAFAVADGTVRGAGVLASLWPDQGSVSLQTPGQRAYLEMERPMRENAFSNSAFRAEMRAAGGRPAPVVVNWGAGTPPYKVSVSANGRTAWSRTLPTRSAEIYNLEIARSYQWKSVDAKGETVGAGRFRTADEAPRFVMMPGVPNVRDLGGWIGLDGRRVRQGRIYRSAGWNANARSVVQTNGTTVATNYIAGASRLEPVAAELFLKPLGIRTDLDLRSDAECRGMTGSPLGKDVKWVQISSGNYWDLAKAEWQEAFASAFRVLLDERNYPLVIHCIAGADRTGSLACVLNGLLGVPEDDLAKDWESTGFSDGHPKFRHDIRWDPLVKVFDAYPGATLNDRIEAFVRARGFTDEDIGRFRGIMLEPAEEKR